MRVLMLLPPPKVEEVDGHHQLHLFSRSQNGKITGGGWLPDEPPLRGTARLSRADIVSAIVRFPTCQLSNIAIYFPR